MSEARGSDAWIVFALFFLVFAAYLFCAYPALAPRDSADLALAALKLGVAHPPGYPLYALLGRLWLILMPLGNPAYRLNLMSAAAGAGACVMSFRVVRRRAGRGPGLACALALGGAAPLWKFSLLCEMYSLHALFILLLVDLADGSRETLSRRARLSGFLFGLGLVNHQSLVLFLPGLLWLWRGEFLRHGSSWKQAAPRAASFALLGLSLYAFVWLRLGDLSSAWSMVSRAQYGSFTLFGGFSRALVKGTALNLLSYWVWGSAAAGGWFVIALAAVGWLDLWRARSAWAGGIGLGLLAAGPGYFLMTRFELSEWVARTVLEPAFIPSLTFLCLLSGAGLSALRGISRPLARIMSIGLAVSPLWLNAPSASHRDDFSAYDYLRDLRRELPPGSVVLAGGDTALFGLKYLEAVSPRAQPLRVASAPSVEGVGWERGRGRFFCLGLPVEVLRSWGLIEGKQTPQPQGLVQEILPESPGVGHEKTAWELSVLRWGPALASGESYAHDVRLSYAFAHYVSARLEELSGPGASIEHDRWARLLDPEDYRLERQGGLY